jgi:hypothetical protein
VDTATQIIVGGLTLGAMYAISTVSLSLIWGALNVLNMAQSALGYRSRPRGVSRAFLCMSIRPSKESLKLHNLNFLGWARMDNLLKAHPPRSGRCVR